MGSLGLTTQQKTTVAILLAGALLVVLNQTLLSPALPMIMRQMSVDAVTVQWLTSAYALTEAIVIPLSAWFMSRVRTRPLFIGCMSLFACGSIVAAVAPVFGVLLVGRIMQATATGVMMVLVFALILLTFPLEVRGRGMGLVSLVIAFAPAVGPSIGGVLVDAVGWRLVFCVVTVLAAVMVVLAWKLLVDRGGFPPAPFDAPSVVFSSLGLATLLYGITSITSSIGSGDALLRCAALVAVGAVFTGLFVRRQLRLEEPILCVAVLKTARYRMAAITIILMQAALMGGTVLLPLYMQNVLGLTPTQSGLVMLPGAAIGAFTSLLAGRAFDRSGVRKPAVLGASILLVAAIAQCFYAVDSPVLLVVVGNTLVCVGLQTIMTPVNTWGVNSLPNEVVQHATALSNTMNQIAAAFGVAVVMSFTVLGTALPTGAGTAASAVEQTFAGYHLSFLVASALITVLVAVILFFVRDRNAPGREKAAASV